MTAKKSAAKSEETPVTDTVKLYNPNDGVFGRDGGPYLDQVQARELEEYRALREGREPDFDNLQPHPGIPLVTKENLVQNYNSTIIAGDDQKKFTGEVEAPVVSEVAVQVTNDDASAEETVVEADGENKEIDLT